MIIFIWSWAHEWVPLSTSTHRMSLVRSERLLGTNRCLMFQRDICVCTVRRSGPTRSSTPPCPCLMRTWVGTWTTTSASSATDPKSTRVIRTFTILTSCTVGDVTITVKSLFSRPIIPYNNSTWLIFQQSTATCTRQAPSWASATVRWLHGMCPASEHRTTSRLWHSMDIRLR